ncbi:unnamed protein product, partial [Heterotrigona itama]
YSSWSKFRNNDKYCRLSDRMPFLSRMYTRGSKNRSIVREKPNSHNLYCNAHKQAKGNQIRKSPRSLYLPAAPASAIPE